MSVTKDGGGRRYYTAVVKGGVQPALEAAAKRGITAKLVREQAPSGFYETVLRVEDNQLEELVAWFAEPGESKPPFGYPIGTCLIYSEHQESDEDAVVRVACGRCHGVGTISCGRGLAYTTELCSLCGGRGFIWTSAKNAAQTEAPVSEADRPKRCPTCGSAASGPHGEDSVVLRRGRPIRVQEFRCEQGETFFMRVR